jgi:hypothetical protein
MFVGSFRMFVSRFAMFVSSLGMLLRFFVLAKIVMMCGLMMMVGRGVMIRGGLMMMLAGWMLRRLCHVVFLPNESVKTIAGCGSHIENIVLTEL